MTGREEVIAAFNFISGPTLYVSPLDHWSAPLLNAAESL